MAKVLNPLHSDRALGSVGTLTYTESRQGATVRQKVNPAQPRSTEQLSIRAILAQASRAWGALTDANRTAWDNYAASRTEPDAFGNQVSLSGQNWFVRLTCRLLNQSKAQVDTPPTASAPASPASFAATGGSGQVSLTWTAFAGTATSVEVWLQAKNSAGVKSDFRKATLNCYAPGETSPKVVTGLTPGEYAVFARAVSESDGQVSTIVSDTFTVS